MCLAAHDLEFRRWPDGVDRRICQTFAASPAEPAELPLGFEVGQQAFAVIREAIRKEGMAAIAKVVFTTREHIIALEARGKGLLGITLRYPYEVRETRVGHRTSGSDPRKS